MESRVGVGGADRVGVVPSPGPSWLGIEARPAVETLAFTKLIPRQELVPVPYALQSAWAAGSGYAGEALVARALKGVARSAMRWRKSSGATAPTRKR